VLIASDLGRAALLLIFRGRPVRRPPVSSFYAVLLLTGALTVLSTWRINFAFSFVLPLVTTEPHRRRHTSSSPLVGGQVVGPTGRRAVSLMTAPFALLVDALSF